MSFYFESIAAVNIHPNKVVVSQQSNSEVYIVLSNTSFDQQAANKLASKLITVMRISKC